MTSHEDLRSPLISSVVSSASSTTKCNELCDQALPPSIAINLVPASPPPIFVSMKSNETNNTYEHRQISIPRRLSARHLSMTVISRQLTIRKILQNRLGFISNIMCFLGLLGMILMIIENEINFVRINNRDTDISSFIKLIITISTVILVGLVIYYHHLYLKFYAAQNSLDHWRVGLTVKKIFLIILEILICAIHPMPRYFPPSQILNHETININSTISNSVTATSPISKSYIAADVILGLPMFARLYLVGRCILFHSHLFRDAPSKTLVSLNQVSINFTFLIKTYLEQWPARCSIIFCFIMFFIGSWSIRACDYKPTVAEHISMFDSMWLFITTFTTVSYGDLTPSTYCGRTVASVIALIGVCATALLISVVAHKLQLTRWERYAHHFASDMKLTRGRREQAANVIKFAMKVWYLKRKERLSSVQYLKAQRTLYRSIYIFRRIKHKQRKLTDNCLGLVELINIQRYTNIKTEKMAQEMTIMKLTMNKIEQKYADMDRTMNNIQHKLDLLLDKER